MTEREVPQPKDIPFLKTVEFAFRKELLEFRLRRIAAKAESIKIAIQAGKITRLINRQYNKARDSVGLIEYEQVVTEIADIFVSSMNIDLDAPACSYLETYSSSDRTMDFYETPIEGITLRRLITTNKDHPNKSDTYFAIERRSPGSFPGFVEHIKSLES